MFRLRARCLDNLPRCSASSSHICAVSSPSFFTCASLMHQFWQPLQAHSACRCSNSSMQEQEEVLDAVCNLLRTLQQLQCNELHHQLQDVFDSLGKNMLLFPADGMGTNKGSSSFAKNKQRVIASMERVQRLGNMHTHRLTELIHAFCETEMTTQWPGNVCKSVATTDVPVVLLIEIVTGKAWLAPALRQRLTSCLQLQASRTESQLSDLWTYMSEALQVHSRTVDRRACRFHWNP